jgi:hypothetical protein
MVSLHVLVRTYMRMQVQEFPMMYVIILITKFTFTINYSYSYRFYYICMYESYSTQWYQFISVICNNLHLHIVNQKALVTSR